MTPPHPSSTAPSTAFLSGCALLLAAACASSPARDPDPDPAPADAATAGGGGGRGGTGGRGEAGASGGRGGAGGTAGAGGAAGASTGGGGNGGSGGSAGSTGGVDGGAAGGAGGAAGGASGGPADAGRADTAAPAGNPFVYVSGYDPQIRIFELNMTTGALTAGGMAAAGSNPSYLAWTPDRKYLYALNEGSPGRIIAFSIAPATGALTRINDGSSGGNGPAHLSVHKGGKHVLSSNYGSGHVAVLPIMGNGGVGTPTDTQKPFDRMAHQILNDVSGKFVHVPATGPNAVAQFAFDAQAGKLTPAMPPTVAGAVVGGANQEPRHIAFHPDEKFAYVVNERGRSVTSYAYDAATGKLTPIETVSALPPNAPGGGSGAHILVHPSGKFLYASMRGHNSIAIFTIDAGTGKVTRVDNETGGGMIRTPRDFTLDPTGAYLLVANQDTGNVIVFRVNATDGKLTRVGGPVTAPGASFVGVMPRP